MKTILLSCLAAGCTTALVFAAEPNAGPANLIAWDQDTIVVAQADASASPSPSTDSSATPDESPAPVHHRHYRAATPTPTPAPSATPKKQHWFWQKKSAAAKGSPAASPSETPAKKKEHAAATPAPSASPTPEATPEATPKAAKSSTAAPSPSPTSKAKKAKGGNFWGGMFKHHPKATPTPSVSPSPSATPHKHHPKPAATPDESAATPTPDEGSSMSAPETTPKAPTPAPTPKHSSSHIGDGMNSEVPFVPSQDEKPANTGPVPTVETKTPQEEEAEISGYFDAAKTKALKDPHILDLQSKADAATGDDAKAAERRYYRALYDKMRDIDPAVKDRIDRTEAATMRRVGSDSAQ